MEDHTAYIDDPLQKYLSEVQRIPSLDRAEEIACIEHVYAGDELAESARSRLVEANLQLVVSIAHRHTNNQIHILDLIEKGNEGLLRAMEALPSSSIDQFSTHAVSYVENAIADAIAHPVAPPLPAHRRAPTA